MSGTQSRRISVTHASTSSLGKGEARTPYFVPSSKQLIFRYIQKRKKKTLKLVNRLDQHCKNSSQMTNKISENVNFHTSKSLRRRVPECKCSRDQNTAHDRCNKIAIKHQIPTNHLCAIKKNLNFLQFRFLSPSNK